MDNICLLYGRMCVFDKLFVCGEGILEKEMSMEVELFLKFSFN